MDEVVESKTWGGPAPRIAVLVASYRRSGFLRELVDALEHQELPAAAFEVVIVDNGSADRTWDELTAIADETSLRLRAIRVGRNRGPGHGRNIGARAVRAPILAITDDDCLPTSRWLQAVLAAFEVSPGLEVAQGAVRPDPAHVDAMGPWDHTKLIAEPTPFFETCNVTYRRAAFERVGGFDESDALLHPKSGRAFGEDACLAWAVVESGGEHTFLEDAVVVHRCIPSTYQKWLDDMAHVRGFPGLARRSPLVATWLHKGRFLSRTSEAFDLALLGVVLAAVIRRPWPLVATWPWLRRRGYEALRARPDDRLQATRVLAGYALGDLVACVRLVQGSIEYRRVVL